MGPRVSLVIRVLLLVCVVATPATALAGPGSEAGAVDRTGGADEIGAPAGAMAGPVGPADEATGRPASGPSAAASLPSAETVGTIGTIGTVTQQTAAPESAPGVSIAVERVTPTTLAIRVRYDLPASVRDLRVVTGETEIRGTEGFERCESNRLCWDESTSEPTFSVRYDLERYTEASTGILNDSVAFVPAPRLYTVWRTSEDRRTAPLFAKRRYDAYDVAGERTVLANAMVFHGPHAEYERVTEDGTTFRLVVPEGTRLGPSRERLFDALSSASRDLDIGGTDREVIVVALAGRSRASTVGLAGATVGNAYWARAGSSLSSVQNVWLHEYVHTRQRFADRGRAMEWFVEASAEYYAARLAYELDLVSGLEYEWRFTSHRVSASESTLAEPATWERPTVPYRKGTLVLAALDTEIRNRTDGEHTLKDVFRRLNRDDRRLTYPRFVATVVAVSDAPELEEWVDRYVKGSPTPQYEPREPEGRLPNPPRINEVAALIPTTPLGFGVTAIGLVIATMLTVGVLSTIGRALWRLIGAIFDALGWLADVLSGRRR
ncbi:hypothetical protein BRC86_11845 [Halobacteriales archaeon QS_3_64_16]|nr:MAG: hypothetical protein BRC86_11845 [Halobacteriales archaeon QS_3_64_16]